MNTSDDDAELLARLGSLMQDTAPPPEAAERARQGFALRWLDAEVAALVSDSEEELTVRQSSPARRLVFESADGALSLELTVTTSGSRHQLEGHVLPAGPVRVEVEHASSSEPAPAPSRVTADPSGGFLLDDVPEGSVRLTCRRDDERPVRTEWLLLP